MKNNLALVTFVITLFVFSSFAQTKNSYAEKVADAYGFNNFKNVKSISFTFNVKVKDKTFTRNWYWEPTTNKVTYKGPGKDGKEMSYTYTTGSMNKNDSIKTFVDARFINDQYWLLFPFHLVWDKKAEITDAGTKPYPISKKKSHCIIVKYLPSAGGYTPGDIFELYIGKDNLIHEWVYKSGGSAKNERAFTWEGYKKINGLQISTQHNVSDHKFRLWFSDIKVALK